MNQDADPHAWLEAVEAEPALDWVRAQNARSIGQLAGPSFEALRQRLRAIYDSKEKIPAVTQRAGLLYNFWTDEEHPRGLIRRTTLEEYRGPSPAWETVLDLDALAQEERENWVFAGSAWLRPSHDRLLFLLSRGGGDAIVVREFDPAAKRFLEDGFVLPEAKTDVSWVDPDHLYVGTDFGPGSLTSSGYPRIVKLWQRGTPLAQARTIYEGDSGDVAVSADRLLSQGIERHLVVRSLSFYSNRTFWLRSGALVPVEKPDDASVSAYGRWMLLSLRSDWSAGGTTFPAGALLAIDWDAFFAGDRGFEALFVPAPNKSLDAYTATKSALILNELEDVRARLYVLRPPPSAGPWTREPLLRNTMGTVVVSAFDSERSDAYFQTTADFLEPQRLSLAELGPAGRPEDQAGLLKSLPRFFEAPGHRVSQGFATSKDGTRVPYFLVAPEQLSQPAPTILYGYGGFEVSLTPNYLSSIGPGWLEKGGVYVLANIRGGGEFGPPWHQAALREHRQRAYDDFIAVAEDLITRQITTPRRLGIMGGSNGGLLMGVMLTQRPELFGAIVCSVPLLDMKRYHLLLAGASWMEEYGDPDRPEDWAFIQRYSPYHQLKPGLKLPPVLFTTSTKDDRVHPGHARKMLARLQEYGLDGLLYENIEGGHGGAANNEQRAFLTALELRFLEQQLMDPGPAGPGSAR